MALHQDEEFCIEHGKCLNVYFHNFEEQNNKHRVFQILSCLDTF